MNNEIKSYLCRYAEKGSPFVWRYECNAHNKEEAEVKARAIISGASGIPCENLATISITERRARK